MLNSFLHKKENVNFTAKTNVVHCLLVIRQVILHSAMKKIVFVILIGSLGWTSCVKESTPQQLTKKEIKQKVDSILVEKSKEIEEAGKVDLNLRMKIEVKVKADSILNAQKQQLTKDTTTTKTQPPGMRNIRIPDPAMQNPKVQQPKVKQAE